MFLEKFPGLLDHANIVRIACGNKAEEMDQAATIYDDTYGIAMNRITLSCHNTFKRYFLGLILKATKGHTHCWSPHMDTADSFFKMIAILDSLVARDFTNKGDWNIDVRRRKESKLVGHCMIQSPSSILWSLTTLSTQLEDPKARGR